jgi:hypothetical protein
MVAFKLNDNLFSHLSRAFCGKSSVPAVQYTSCRQATIQGRRHTDPVICVVRHLKSSHRQISYGLWLGEVWLKRFRTNQLHLAWGYKMQATSSIEALIYSFQTIQCRITDDIFYDRASL